MWHSKDIPEKYKHRFYYFDKFCNAYWNRSKGRWDKKFSNDCIYNSKAEALQDDSLYKGEDTVLHVFSPLALAA
jgi:hypothetical protein